MADELEHLDLSELPESLREIVEVIGLTPALRLAERWGGVRIYIPQNLQDDHPLVEVLGLEPARALSARFARESMPVPRCAAGIRAARDRQIRAARHAGEGTGTLALRYGLTERRVFSILNSDPDADDNRQQSFL